MPADSSNQSYDMDAIKKQVIHIKAVVENAKKTA